MKEKIYNKYQKEYIKYSELFKKLADIAENGTNEDFKEVHNQLVYSRGRMDALEELYESLGG